MTGAIPKYGKHFRLETRLPYNPDWASRKYVLKENEKFFIRSTNDSEHWQIFIAGPNDAAFPHGDPFDTLTEAMPALVSHYESIKDYPK